MALKIIPPLPLGKNRRIREQANVANVANVLFHILLFPEELSFKNGKTYENFAPELKESCLKLTSNMAPLT